MLLKEKGVNNGLSEIHLARYQTVTDHCCDFGLHGSWRFYLAAIAHIDMFAAQIFRKTLALCGNDQGLVRNSLPGCSSLRFLIFPHTKKHACFKSVFLKKVFCSDRSEETGQSFFYLTTTAAAAWVPELTQVTRRVHLPFSSLKALWKECPPLPFASERRFPA